MYETVLTHIISIHRCIQHILIVQLTAIHVTVYYTCYFNRHTDSIEQLHGVIADYWQLAIYAPTVYDACIISVIFIIIGIIDAYYLCTMLIYLLLIVCVMYLIGYVVVVNFMYVASIASYHQYIFIFILLMFLCAIIVFVLLFIKNITTDMLNKILLIE